MKTTLNYIGLSILLLFYSFAYAQENVTLTVDGIGKNQEEAKLAAFRNAIEQAFGTFISSKTEILNDNLIKDEIVSISNGNIKEFKILSQIQLPSGEYSMLMKATVSVSKLTSFIENKGYAVEYKGTLFANNIKLQKLNETAENKAINNLLEVVNKLKDNSFRYEIDMLGEPVSQDGGSNQWKIPISIKTYTTKNYSSIISYLVATLEGLSLTQDEIKNFNSLNKAYYTLNIYSDNIHTCNSYNYSIYSRPSGYYSFQQGELIKKTKSLDSYLKAVNWPNFTNHSCNISCNKFVDINKLKPKTINLRNSESMSKIKSFFTSVNSLKKSYLLTRRMTNGGNESPNLDFDYNSPRFSQQTDLMPFEKINSRLEGNNNTRHMEWHIGHHSFSVPKNSVVLLNYQENIEISNVVVYDVISLEKLEIFNGYEIK